jgi:hypothetical protein
MKLGVLVRRDHNPFYGKAEIFAGFACPGRHENPATAGIFPKAASGPLLAGCLR